MTRRTLVRTLTGTTLAMPLGARAAGDEALDGKLRKLLDDATLPGAVAVLIKEGKIRLGARAGERKKGSRAMVTLEDKFHLGSCTKSMTATLAAVLVERGKIRWDSTIRDFVKDQWVHPDFRKVDLIKLLCHSGGCPSQPENDLWMELFFNKKKLSPRNQREKLAKGILSSPPIFPPGEKFLYSNAGYAMAGLLMERATKSSWETLMTDELFEPLGIETGGFRAPGTNRSTDQPWGHRDGKAIEPEPYGDNPHAIGPAGTVHMSIGDWAKFALLHLGEKPGALLKKPESIKMLHRVHSPTDDYGLGWIVLENEGGPILSHDGSNTMWYASSFLQPATKTGTLVCVNAGGEKATQFCHETRKMLLAHADG